MKSILAAATILSTLAIATTAAHATPINYSFTVTATSGPLSGDTATGTFSYDSSSIIPGGINNAGGLLTGLNFTWNGITYNQTTANTGQLVFNSSGNLTAAIFGDNCSPGSCGLDSNTNNWAVFGPRFGYATPSTDDLYVGTATVSLVTAPEPSTLALLGVGLAGTMLMGARVSSRHRREAALSYP